MDKNLAVSLSPLRLFSSLLVIIFFVETCVMYAINSLPLANYFYLSLLDAVLLSVLVAPFLWWFVVRPLRRAALVEQARASAIITNAADGIITIDQQGLVRSCNPAARKMFAYSEEELVGKPLTLLMPERCKEAHVRGIERGRLTGKSDIVGRTLDLQGLTKDGSELPLEIVVTSWNAEEETLYTGIIRNITKRKLAEQQILQDKNRLHALFDINVAITSIALDLRNTLQLLLEKICVHLPSVSATAVTLLNRDTGVLDRVACRNIDEKEWKKIESSPIRGLNKVVFETQAPVIAVNAQTDPRTEDIEFFAKQGLVSYLGVPLVIKGKVLGILTFYTRTEHAFNTDEVEFLTTLANQAATVIDNSQLYEQTKKQTVELEEANRAQADFTAMIVHDLRNPLTNVTAITEMMEKGLLGPLNVKQKKWIGRIRTNICDLLELVDNIMDLSKLEAGRIDLVKKDINLEQLAHKSIEDFTPQANSKKVSITSRIDPSLPRVKADPRRLEQVFTNLLSNALKFTPEGGRVEIIAGHKTVGTTSEIQVRVKDSGVGIHAKDLKQLFQKYRQVTNGKTSNRKGTGLGLVICKMIMEAHGGRIWVDSKPRKSSTFTFTIPCENGRTD